MSHPALEILATRTRRHFLRDSAMALGGVAMALMEHEDGRAATTMPASGADPFLPKPTHFPARAKNVIFLSMSGGPPHLDLFDYKPELVRRNGEDCPESLTKGKQFAFTSGTPRLLGTRQKFSQHGNSGAWLSAALPDLARLADDMTIIKSVCTEQFNHGPAELLLYTGFPRRRAGRLSAHGSPMAWAPRAATCRATSCSSRGIRSPAPARRPGEAASFRPFTKAFSAEPAAIRSCTCRTRGAWTVRCGA